MPEDGWQENAKRKTKNRQRLNRINRYKETAVYLRFLFVYTVKYLAIFVRI